MLAANSLKDFSSISPHPHSWILISSSKQAQIMCRHSAIQQDCRFRITRACLPFHLLPQSRNPPQVFSCLQRQFSFHATFSHLPCDTRLSLAMPVATLLLEGDRGESRFNLKFTVKAAHEICAHNIQEWNAIIIIVTNQPTNRRHGAMRTN